MYVLHDILISRIAPTLLDKHTVVRADPSKEQLMMPSSCRRHNTIVD